MGDMRRNGKIPKLLTTEEWTRINDHLLKLEKFKENDFFKKQTEIDRSEKLKQCNRHLEKPLKHTEMFEIEKFPDLVPAIKEDMKRKEVIYRAKEILFENKDYARRLLRGLRLSTVLHERNSQIEFNRILKQQREIKEKDMIIKSQEEALHYEEELRKNRVKKLEKIEGIKKELDRQIQEKLEKQERDLLEKAYEKTDLIKMDEELKILMEEERVTKERRKKELTEDIQNYINSENAIRDKLKIKEKEEDEINKIYQEVYLKIDKKRKETEKARFRKVMKIDHDLSQNVEKQQKLQSHGDEKLKELLLLKEARKKFLLEDILQGRKMAEEELERSQAEKKFERKQSALRRCRKEEADRIRKRMEEEERQKMMKNTMECYIKQWMEKEREQKMEKELNKLYIPNFTAENKLITRYCDEILRLVKRNKRPLYPVVAAVKEIKREFGLECERNPNFLKSNVPIGK